MKPEIIQSYASDDTMSLQEGSAEDYEANRKAFLERHGIAAERAVLVGLRYEGDDYCRYHTIDKTFAGDGMVRPSNLVADALFTHEKNLVLFLPIADCVGCVLYDEREEILGLAHFGRHNLVQRGGTKAIEYMSQQFGSKPENILIYLSPAAGAGNYPLHDFDGRSLHDVVHEQLLGAGIVEANVQIDMRDTTIDAGLFSHSEFLKGTQPTDGRHAIACRLRESNPAGSDRAKVKLRTPSSAILKTT